MNSHAFDPKNPDDRLAHLVAMMFDGFALTSDYGGVVQCPYDPEADKKTELPCDEDEDRGSVATAMSSPRLGTSGDDTTVEIAHLDEKDGCNDGVPETKM